MEIRCECTFHHGRYSEQTICGRDAEYYILARDNGAISTKIYLCYNCLPITEVNRAIKLAKSEVFQYTQNETKFLPQGDHYTSIIHYLKATKSLSQIQKLKLISMISAKPEK